MAVQIAMAALKICWATSVTICILQFPSSSEGLVKASTSSFSFLSALEGEKIFLVVQSLLLLSILAIVVAFLMPTQYISSIKEAVKFASSLATLILLAVWFFNKLKTVGTAKSSVPAGPDAETK